MYLPLNIFNQRVLVKAVARSSAVCIGNILGLGQGKWKIREKSRQTAMAAAPKVIHRLRGRKSSWVMNRYPKQAAQMAKIKIDKITFSHTISLPAAIQ